MLLQAVHIHFELNLIVGWTATVTIPSFTVPPITQ